MQETLPLQTEQIISRQEEELNFTCNHSSFFYPFPQDAFFFKHGPSSLVTCSVLYWHEPHAAVPLSPPSPYVYKAESGGKLLWPLLTGHFCDKMVCGTIRMNSSWLLSAQQYSIQPGTNPRSISFFPWALQWGTLMSYLYILSASLYFFKARQRGIQ